jgi:hypothetical protein
MTQRNASNRRDKNASMHLAYVSIPLDAALRACQVKTFISKYKLGSNDNNNCNDTNVYAVRAILLRPTLN